MRAARVDANHAAIVEGFRGVGMSATSLAPLKNGEGDVLVGHQGRNYLFEIKDPSKSKSRTKQTERGLKFAASWRGQRAVIFHLQEGLAIIAADQDEIHAATMRLQNAARLLKQAGHNKAQREALWNRLAADRMWSARCPHRPRK